MTHDSWFCLDCMQLRDLDVHARCSCCGSDSLTPACGRAPRKQAAIPIAPQTTLILRTRIPIRSRPRLEVLSAVG